MKIYKTPKPVMPQGQKYRVGQKNWTIFDRW